jgi:hypothetical protein
MLINRLCNAALRGLCTCVCVCVRACARACLNARVRAAYMLVCNNYFRDVLYKPSLLKQIEAEYWETGVFY